MDNIFTGGLSTKQTVKALNEQIPVSQGTRVSYERIGEVIETVEPGVSWHGKRHHRFRTIMNAWRKCLLDEKNLETEAENGIGIRVMTSEERPSMHCTKQKNAIKKIVRTGKRSAMVPTNELSESALRKRDHAVKIAASIKNAFDASKNQLRFDLKEIAQKK